MASHDLSSTQAPSRVVKLESRFDFSATVSRFKETLQSRGVKVFAEIDQTEAASQAGSALRSTTLFIFGNPKAGTPIMAANPYAAIELPMRAVISDEQPSGVYIYYQDMVQILADEYGISPDLLGPMQASSKLMRLIAGQE